MRAISVWQPWASLIQTGAKKIETRSWSTNYRGPLLICSAIRKVKSELIHYLCCSPFTGALQSLVPDTRAAGHLARTCGLDDLLFGHALCLVDLVDCLPVEDIPYGLILPEMSFGDYSAGRFGWIMENLRTFKPFSIKGGQRIFKPIFCAKPKEVNCCHDDLTKDAYARFRKGKYQYILCEGGFHKICDTDNIIMLDEEIARIRK